MHSIFRYAVWAALAAPALAVADGGVEDVRKELDALKRTYEARIQALESRIHELEQAPAAPLAASAPPLSPSPRSDQVTSGSAFNPQISVILDGVYYGDNVNGRGGELLGAADGIHHVHGPGGHEHGHAHGSLDRGFNLRETEVAFSATVDPYFDANLLLAISSDGDVELEEAYFTTRNLPAGLKVKGGKFLSNIGYANSQHPHEWDFVDQNLAYLNLLGDHGLADTGLQLTWLPDLPVYTLFGVEAFQGEQERLGATVDEHGREAAVAPSAGALDEDALGLADVKRGPRLWTGFVKVAPDLGSDHAVQLGAFGGKFNQHQEIHGEFLPGFPPAPPGETPLHALEGDAWFWGLDGVYKYDAGRAFGHGDWKVQGEYLWTRKDLDLTYHQNPAVVGQDRVFTQDGFYLQALYGFAPRWSAGLRYDKVGMTNERTSSAAPGTNRTWDSSDRWTAAVTWTPTEFSRLRLQFAQADIAHDGEREKFNTVFLQYLMSLGSHGAHKF